MLEGTKGSLLYLDADWAIWATRFPAILNASADSSTDHATGAQTAVSAFSLDLAGLIGQTGGVTTQVGSFTTSQTINVSGNITNAIRSWRRGHGQRACTSSIDS